MRVLALLTLFAATAGAEAIPDPKKLEATSDDGRWRVVVTPGKRTSEAEVTRDGKAVWKAPVDHPRQVFITDDGWVATVELWLHGGGEHVFVTRDPKGRVVVDKRLEEILTAAELQNTSFSRAGRRWMGGVASLSGDRVEIPLRARGSVAVLAVKDGAQFRDGKPFDVPADAVRFKGFVTGKRKATAAKVRFMIMTQSGKDGRACEAVASASTCTIYQNGVQSSATTAFTAKKLAAAIASAAFLSGAPRGRPQVGVHDMWMFAFDFTEDGYTYSYAWFWYTTRPAADVKKLAARFGFTP
jgi:hypothetical protein